jgi:transcriptional regulator with XRE-family HTH domain
MVVHYGAGTNQSQQGECVQAQAVGKSSSWLGWSCAFVVGFFERLWRGWQKELADFLGVPKPRVIEWLSGRVKPGGETTLKMFRWLVRSKDAN